MYIKFRSDIKLNPSCVVVIKIKVFAVTRNMYSLKHKSIASHYHENGRLRRCTRQVNKANKKNNSPFIFFFNSVQTLLDLYTGKTCFSSGVTQMLCAVLGLSLGAYANIWPGKQKFSRRPLIATFIVLSQSLQFKRLRVQTNVIIANVLFVV